MPELPEVETVKNTLKRQVLNKKIMDVKVYYKNIIAGPKSDEFIKGCINDVILNITRRGKWIIFELNHYFLLSHLRMEGKYFIKDENESPLKHEHVCFIFSDHTTLRYIDTRKFGRMYLLEKDEIEKKKPLNELGLEPFDESLTVTYLKNKLKNKKIPIKISLLDQSIIAGIGNIYANEILFLANIDPNKVSYKITKKELENIIEKTKFVLKKAISLGGTTIRSYTSSEGVHGKFQNELYVHGKEGETCLQCGDIILKKKIGGRGTYYCPKCQK